MLILHFVIFLIFQQRFNCIEAFNMAIRNFLRHNSKFSRVTTLLRNQPSSEFTFIDNKNIIKPNSIRNKPPDMIPDYDQQAVIKCSDPAVMIIAGPGSGKTRVMAARLVHLLTSSLCNPSECLIISFTKDAAENVKKIAQTMLFSSDSVATTRDVACFTFHALCHDVLDQHSTLVMKSRKKWFSALQGDQINILLNVMESKGMSLNDGVAKNIDTIIRLALDYRIQC